MKVSDYISQFLEERGVKVAFELSGGMITHLLDSFHRRGRIRCVSVHHEQAAALAADAFGRMTGLPGVALATSGPGATNLLTGIGSCYFDSSPAVFITGQVNRHEQKGDRPIRQLGFQETDIVSMARPITKAAWAVTRPEDVPSLLEDAFRLATNGRPGPVLLDVPMDIQRAELDLSSLPPATPAPARRQEWPPDFWAKLQDQIERARRPLILAGGGLRSGQAVTEFRRFVDRVGVPVVHSLMGVDVLPWDHPRRVGLIGTYGNRWANLALGQSDFLLVLGSRLDVRQTGSQTGAFKAGRTIVHVDCDPGEINNRVTGCEAVVSELKPFLDEATRRFPASAETSCEAWIQEIQQNRARWPDDLEQRDIAGINPNRFMHLLSRASKTALAYVVDVGQHQMWAAQSIEMGPEQRFLTSGGMGSMGFALPAALGAAFARPPAPLVVVAGDGGFQCNIQELQTVARNRLPLKIVVVNNRCHGMVRQFQESYFESRFQSTLWGYSTPDFVRVAQAYGIAARKVEQEAEVPAALDWLWSGPLQPALLEVAIDQRANAHPKVAFGQPITVMEPLP